MSSYDRALEARIVSAQSFGLPPRSVDLFFLNGDDVEKEFICDVCKCSFSCILLRIGGKKEKAKGFFCSDHIIIATKIFRNTCQEIDMGVLQEKKMSEWIAEASR